MKLKQRLYNLFPFIPRTNLFIGRKLYSYKVIYKKKAVKSQLLEQTNIYANIGCGDAGLTDNWTNIDYVEYKNVNYIFDCRKELPFAENTVKGIFCEHFFEHIDYYTEVPYFLKSCFQSLQPQGILRIIVPDAEKYLYGYCQEGWDYLKKTRPLNDNLLDGLMGIQYQTKMQLVNEVFRQNGEHKYAWDYETMSVALNEAGFSKVHKMEYSKSNDPKLAIDQLIRRPESLYVEAIK